MEPAVPEHGGSHVTDWTPQDVTEDVTERLCGRRRLLALETSATARISRPQPGTHTRAGTRAVSADRVRLYTVVPRTSGAVQVNKESGTLDRVNFNT